MWTISMLEEIKSDVLGEWRYRKGEDVGLADIWPQENQWKIFTAKTVTSYIDIPLNGLTSWVIV